MPKHDKEVPQKADTISSAWVEKAPQDSLAGMTQAEFDAKVSASKAKRAKRVALAAQLRANSEEIVAADKVTRDTIQAVIGAVRGHPSHGSDSALLAAMGYITTSQRKTGKTNKTNGNGNGNSQPHS